MQGLKVISTQYILRQSSLAIAIFSIFCGFGGAGVASASPLIAAYEMNKNKFRDPANFGVEYKLFFAAIPVAKKGSSTSSLPESRMVSVPVSISVFEAKDWYLFSTQGDECFIPEIAIINVTSISNQGVTGALNWHPDYRGEAPRCRDRIMPNKSGLCADGQAPKFKPCTNGAIVTLDFSQAMTATGQPLDGSVYIEKIQAAIKR